MALTHGSFSGSEQQVTIFAGYGIRLGGVFPVKVSERISRSRGKVKTGVEGGGLVVAWDVLKVQKGFSHVSA